MECGKGAFAHPRLLENLEPIAFAIPAMSNALADVAARCVAAAISAREKFGRFHRHCNLDYAQD